MLGDAKSRGPATIAPRWRRDKQLFSEGVRLFRRPAKARRLLFPGHWFFCGCGVFRGMCRAVHESGYSPGTSTCSHYPWPRFGFDLPDLLSFGG
jgi:hypothetical protein